MTGVYAQVEFPQPMRFTLPRTPHHPIGYPRRRPLLLECDLTAPPPLSSLSRLTSASPRKFPPFPHVTPRKICGVTPNFLLTFSYFVVYLPVENYMWSAGAGSRFLFKKEGSHFHHPWSPKTKIASFKKNHSLTLTNANFFKPLYFLHSSLVG